MDEAAEMAASASTAKVAAMMAATANIEANRAVNVASNWHTNPFQSISDSIEGIVLYTIFIAYPHLIKTQCFSQKKLFTILFKSAAQKWADRQRAGRAKVRDGVTKWNGKKIKSFKV